MLVILYMCHVFVQTKEKNIESKKDYSIEVKTMGYDEAIYYTSENSCYYSNWPNFPSSIRVSLQRGNSLYSGVLTYKGSRGCD